MENIDNMLNNYKPDYRRKCDLDRNQFHTSSCRLYYKITYWEHEND